MTEVAIDPKSETTIGYHIFLQPNGHIADELNALIKRLPAKYEGPVFTPHVTVLGRIPEAVDEVVIKKAEALAAGFSPTTLTLGQLDSEQSYFRALYSKIVEQDAVRKMYGMAADAFSVDTSPDFVAHLSILYGNFPEEMLSELTGSITLPTERTFTVDRLHVYRTEGKVGQWHKLKEIPFGA